MILKLHLTSIFYISILYAEKFQNVKEPKWAESLVQYIRNNSGKHHVVLLIEDKDADQMSKIQNYDWEISRKIPFLAITFNELNSSSNKYLILENNPRATTVFVLILFSKNESLSSRLSVPIDFLNRLSKVNSRPKCLIVHLLKERRFTYKKMLQDLWTKQFLDVTVLEIVEKNSWMGREISSLPNAEKEVVVLHNFNPFNKVYESRRFSSKSQWFPEKTRNLYNYEVKALLLKGDFYKEKIGMVDVMSKTMKFRSNVLAIEHKQYGNSGCRKKDYTEKLADILDNKIQFNTGPLFDISSCNKSVYPRSKIIKIGTQVAVVPILYTQRVIIVVSWNLFHTLLFLAVLIMVVHIIPRNCKFQKRFWRPLHVFQILLGMSTSMVPRKIKDRIIFGSILITYVIYSSYLFTALTKIGLNTKSEQKMDTVEDLVKSNLTPFFYSHTYRTMGNSDISRLQELRKKGVDSTFNNTYMLRNCLTDAMKGKNVSCIASKRRVLFNMRNYGEERLNVKIMQEPILYGAYLWMLEPGSPYAERFDQVLQSLLENGVLKKINIIPDTVEVSTKNLTVERSESKELLFLLLSTILFGFSISLITFFVELFPAYYLNKKKCRVTL